MISVKLNLVELTQNLASESGHAVTRIELDSWLARAGFFMVGDTWFAVSAGILNLFRPEEILATSLSVDQKTANTVAAAHPSLLAVTDRTIPSVLVGMPREARKAWRRIANVALKNRSWGVLEGIERIPIDSTPGGIVFRGPVRLTFGNNVLAYLIRDEIRHALLRYQGSRYEGAESERALLLARAKDLWFCLGILGGNLPLLATFACDQGLETRQFSTEILWSLVRFWRDLLDLSKRFMLVDQIYYKWPNWGTNAFSLAMELGVTRKEVDGLQKLSPLEVGQILGRRLIAADRPVKMPLSKIDNEDNPTL